MGFFSDAWDSVTDTASDIVGGATDAISGVLGGGSKKTGDPTSHRSIKHMSRIIRLTYLQTIQILTDQRKVSELAGTTDPSTSSFSLQKPAEERNIVERFFDPFGMFTSGTRGHQWSFSAEDSGWAVTRTWLETFWSYIRYAIGIRDIQVFNFKFAPSSEIVSKQFVGPKEIIKIQLQVEEQIPDIFSLTKRWIEYYVSVDNGKNWIQINPLNNPTLYHNGNIVPHTLNFNIDIGGPTADGIKNFITKAPIKGVRFRAVFLTDPEIEDGDKYTPVLKKYRLKLYPRGGLISNDESDV